MKWHLVCIHRLIGEVDSRTESNRREIDINTDNKSILPSTYFRIKICAQL